MLQGQIPNTNTHSPVDQVSKKPVHYSMLSQKNHNVIIIYHAAGIYLGYQIPAHTGLLISHPDPYVNIRDALTKGPLDPSASFYQQECDTLAEWLRRLTRNQLELFRVGSSPASVDLVPLACFFFQPNRFSAYP